MYGLESLIVIVCLGVIGGSIIRLIMSISSNTRIKSIQEQLDRMERAMMRKTENQALAKEEAVCHETETPGAAEVPVPNENDENVPEPALRNEEPPGVVTEQAETPPPLEQIETSSCDAMTEIIGEVETPPPLPSQTFEPTALDRALAKAWNWFIIGEEFRKPGESWEYAAATHWLLRLGIFTVLAGVAFFLKYSIETGLMGPLGRVSLSLLAGIALIVGGVRQLFKKYHLLGQGLTGAGFVMLYFSFYAASSLYHLMPEPAAFAAMICVTAGAGVLSVRYQSIGIALLGMAGGYVTPIMVDSGASGNTAFFYAYVLLLGVGVLGISLMRRWPLLNMLGMLAAYGLTFLYCGRSHTGAQLLGDLAFLSAIHLLYLLSIVMIHLRKKIMTGGIEWMAIFFNVGIYWSWVFMLFQPAYGKEETGLVSLAMSAVYVALVYLCFKRKLLDQTLITLFILLAVVFLAMTPVLMLSGDWLTLAWCLQALAMFALAQRTGQTFLGKIAVALFAMASVRGMTVDLVRLYDTARPWLLEGTAFWQAAGTRLVLFGVLPASLITAWRMARKHQNAPIVMGLILVQVWVYLTLESALIARVYAQGFRSGAVTLVWTLFAFALLFAGIRLRGQWLRWAGLGLFALTLAKLLMFDLSELATLYRIIAFISTGVVLVLGSFVYLKYKNLIDTEGESVSEGTKE